MKSSHELLKLKSQMSLNRLSLGDVAKEAGVNYSVASAVLNGMRIQPEALARLKNAIRTLTEVAAG